MDFNQVFTFENLFTSYKNSCKGVGWKTSTKNYQARAVQNVAQAYTALHSGKYRQKPFAEFTVSERGKTRRIRALHISDRVVQKCFCDYYLVPLLGKKLIYNNGACMKGKGLNFTANRLKAHLQKYFRENKTNEGYVLTFDFSKYFDSIDHEILLSKVRKAITDDRVYEMYSYMVSCFGGGKGVGLGSQISQISAMFYTNDLDHHVKEQIRMKYYGRYMDDGYVICNSKEKLQECVEVIKRFAETLKLKLNIKKTRIWRIDKGFMFLNRHWTLTEKGYIKLKASHTTLLRMRKRYRKIKEIASNDAVERFVGSTSGFINFFKNRRILEYVYN
jgi:hypothetical protein